MVPDPHRCTALMRRGSGTTKMSFGLFIAPARFFDLLNKRLIKLRRMWLMLEIRRRVTNQYIGHTPRGAFYQTRRS